MRHSERTFLVFPVLALVVGCVTGQSSMTTIGATGISRSVQLTEVVIQMRDMRYTPGIIRINTGQLLMITLVNEDAMNHDFVINDESRPIHLFVSPGKRIATSLFFDQPGIFRFVCSQEGHQAAGMVGRIVVE